MKITLMTGTVIVLIAFPTIGNSQLLPPSRRPVIIQPGDVVRIQAGQCPFTSNRPTTEQVVIEGTAAPQPPKDYQPCINWGTNRVTLELVHGLPFENVITRRIDRLRELGGVDVSKQFLDTKGRELIAVLQQQYPDTYQQHLAEFQSLFSTYGLRL